MKKMTDEQIKPALVHDWLTGMRGGEKVLQQICLLYPDSPLYTLIHEPGELSKIIENRPVYKSLLQYLPLGKRFYRYYLPLLPLLVKSLDTQKHDFVISTSHCVAKNVKAAKGGVHICYCHTPMRYIWDMFDSYFSFRKSPPVYLFMKLFLPYLRYMDVKTAANVDYFIANSGTTAQRIKKHYKREARVIYPPVDTDTYTPANIKKENFYLIVSSLVPYKKVDLAVEAFNKSGRKLRVIGSGPQEEYLKKKAGGNISFYGWLGEEEIKDNYRKCRGLVFPGKEDFGIVPVEAMACGSPVIAYGKGG
ncbi:MAG: glycosyltransferase, partial [Elusimicrobiota bacterium]